MSSPALRVLRTLAFVAFLPVPGVVASITYVEAEKDGVSGVDGLAGASAVAVSPDGAHVYAAGSTDNALAIFSRDAGTGALTFVGFVQDGAGGTDGLAGAAGVAVSPDGAHVYAAGPGDDAIAVFDRDSGTGLLTFVEVQQDGVSGVDGLAGAVAVAVSPDGAHVYVAGGTDNAVAVFSRDGGTGALTFVELEQDGVSGVDGLAGVRGLALSPDGLHLYAAGFGDDSVAVFARNAGTGALTFVERRTVGGGVQGLRGASGVAVSPDGKSVYVAGSTDNALAVFARNATTGALTFIEIQRDNAAGNDGLNAASAVAVSPEGAHVYATGTGDDGVAVFSRAGNGALAFLEVEKDGVAGVDGLDGASSLALAADGGSLYATGTLESGLAAFNVDAVLTMGDARVIERCFGATAVVKVLRSGSAVLGLTVDYATANGTALAGSDYTSTTGTLSFDPGSKELSVAVPVLWNKAVERPESFFVDLSGASGAVIEDGRGTVTIVHDLSMIRCR